MPKSGQIAESRGEDPTVAGNAHDPLAQHAAAPADQGLYGWLRHDILTLALQPGQRISEQIVATRYGGQKAAVRRALLRLGQDGLVESRARSGHYVSTITVRDMRELYTVRKMLLPEAGALAAIRDCRALEQPCQALLATDFAPGEPESILRFCLATRRFTGAIGRASGNRLLAGLVAEIEDRAIRVLVLNSMGLPRLGVLHRQFRDVYEGICSGDPQRAKSVLLHVLEDSEAAANEAVLRLPLLQSVNLGSS